MTQNKGNNSIKQQRFLRNTASAAGTGTASPGVAASGIGGSGSRSNKSDFDITYLQNDDRILKWKSVRDDGRTFVYRMHKDQNNRVEYKEITDTGEGEISTSKVSTYDAALERVNAIKRRIGSCPAFYTNHTYGAVALDFGENLGSLSQTIVAEAICGAFGLVVGALTGPIGGYIAGIVCGTAAYILITSVSGAETTVGLYDDERGPFSTVPSVVAGVSDEYNAEVSDLRDFDRLPFAHLSPFIVR